MRIPHSAACHLTYCTNMHPGETWEEVFRALREFTLPIRDRVCPGARFGVGLRLSDLASRQLHQAATLRDFRAFCEDRGLYVFTINGFPFGQFHGRAIKEEVYRPDWRDPLRLAYSDRLADILSVLLPAEMEGSISTVPCSFKEFITSPDDVRRIVENLVRHVVHLARIREATGKTIQLGLEPEPLCYLETTDELIAFFREHVHVHGLRSLRRQTGWPEAQALLCLQVHLGMCYDTCHQAIEYEEPPAILRRLSAAGIRISKLQISSAMKVELRPGSSGAAGAGGTLAQLERFVEPTYLHQVVEKSPGGIRRYKDLDLALAAFRARPSWELQEAREWRVHFHIPLFLPRVDGIASTRDHIEGLFAHLRGPGEIPHLEIETYTWDVLPARYKNSGVVEAVAREFEWVLKELERPTGA